MLSPATPELITYYKTKLKYSLCAESNNGLYLFFTPNKELLNFLDLENIKYY